MYSIVTRTAKHPEWSIDAVGQPNEFETEEEAWEAIEKLRELGGEWAVAEYNVREEVS